ncbi:M23 family metallopeptidase [Microbacterium lacticum]|uniref:M23 family metallopeptidase n=1 Tax=Microbacterium lacticum TaxID=33885 RepID=UPI001F5865F5|nr:M23 family metallopeptidase [Microbacterium lacticum]
MSAATTYAPDRIGYRYGTPDSAYSKGYHRGQDVRLRGPYGSLVTQVDAIDDGVVVYVGRPNGLLAWTVVIDTGRARGRYESHSHMADISVGVGQRVSSGDRLGRNASMGEDHGFIDGVHDHVTITDRFDGAWVTWLDEYDPLPFMQAAYARATQGGNAAGSGGTPFNPEPNLILEEDNTMLMLRIKVGSGTHLCALGNGVFRHFIPQDPYDKVMKVSRSADDWQDITLAELPAFLRTYGCDLNIWDIRGGAFVVLDPLDGSVRSGNVWTAVNAARSTVAQVKVTSEQTAKYLETLASA